MQNKEDNDGKIKEDGKKYPAVAMYNPYTIRDLEPGTTKLWCACGLSKKQPWCDGSHKGTGISPLKWVVPEQRQTIYSVCACKYTSAPPYCDGSHIHLPAEVIDRQKHCTAEHTAKLCTVCGSTPDW